MRMRGCVRACVRVVCVRARVAGGDIQVCGERIRNGREFARARTFFWMVLTSFSELMLT